MTAESKRRLALFFAYLACIAAVLNTRLNDGFLGDAIGYMGPATAEFSSHPLFPFLHDDTGHPLIICYFVGLFWRVFGQSNVAAHLLIWVCGAVALSATHGLAVRVLGRTRGRFGAEWLGVAGAGCLFVQPLFISYTAQYLSAVPHVAFGMALILALRERRYRAAVAWAVLFSMTRATGAVILAAMGAFELFWLLRNRRSESDIKKLLIGLSPFVAGGLALAAYIGVKTLVLGLPLTSYPSFQTSSSSSLSSLWAELRSAWRGTLFFPRLGMGLWLVTIILGGFAWIVFRLTGVVPRTRSESGDDKHLPNGEGSFDHDKFRVYGLFVVMALAIFIFHTIHGLYNHARFFMLIHPALIIAGIDGLLLLSGRRMAFVVFAVVLWGSVQIPRWHDDWIKALTRGTPSSFQDLRVPHITEQTLDIQYPIELYENMARYVESASPNCLVLGLYPSNAALALPASGYVRAMNHRNALAVTDDHAALAEMIELNRAEGREVIAVLTYLDGAEPDEWRERLNAHPMLKSRRDFSTGHGTWGVVYEFN